METCILLKFYVYFLDVLCHLYFLAVSKAQAMFLVFEVIENFFFFKFKFTVFSSVGTSCFDGCASNVDAFALTPPEI